MRLGAKSASWSRLNWFMFRDCGSIIPFDMHSRLNLFTTKGVELVKKSATRTGRSLLRPWSINDDDFPVESNTSNFAHHTLFELCQKSRAGHWVVIVMLQFLICSMRTLSHASRCEIKGRRWMKVIIIVGKQQKFHFQSNMNLLDSTEKKIVARVFHFSHMVRTCDESHLSHNQSGEVSLMLNYISNWMWKSNIFFFFCFCELFMKVKTSFGCIFISRYTCRVCKGIGK